MHICFNIKVVIICVLSTHNNLKPVCQSNFNKSDVILVSDLKLFYLGRNQNSSIKGQIRLKMWLSTRENRGLNEEEDMWNEIWQHQQIYTIFLRHILSKVQKNQY